MGSNGNFCIYFCLLGSDYRHAILSASCCWCSQDSDNFHKTPCYHYFHVHCLLAYAAHWVAVVKEASHDGQVAGAAQSSDESDGKVCNIPHAFILHLTEK